MNTYSNKLSKIISMVISVSMIMSICAANVAFASDGDRILLDPEMVTYMPGDDSNIGDYKLYMQDNYANAYYSIKHFLRSGEMFPYVVAMAWPPTLRTRTEGDGFPAQKATINNSNNTLTSTASGITYKLPNLNAPTETEIENAQASNSPSQFHKKEALIIDRFGVDNMGYGSQKSADIVLNEKFDKINLLIGVGKKADYGKSDFHIFVTYDDGTTSLPEGATVTNAGTTKVQCAFPDGVLNSEAADGRNGYLCETSPMVTAEAQTAADNFVADFVSYNHQPGSSISSSNTLIYNYTANFIKSTGTKASVAAYEYCLDVDETKTISKITFTQKQATGSAGYVVLGMVGQKAAEDWTDRISQINDKIADLTEEGAEITSSKILEILTEISEAKSKGVDRYINVDEFNSLFTDEFVSDLLEGTDLALMSWEEKGDFFGILDPIYYGIENTDNNVSDGAKEEMQSAFEAIIDSLIEGEDKDEAEIMERFNLLKGTSSLNFQNIFERKVIYEASAPAISSDNEVITIDVDFSQPITEDQLTTDNFIVKRDNEEVNPKWITFEPKTTGSDITGVKVKILNSQEYVEPYALQISRDLEGANGGKWAYQFEESLNASAPVSANTAGVTINAENAISGNIVLNNTKTSSQSYIVLVSSYDEKGMLVGTLPTASLTGTISQSGSATVAINGILPQETSKVICYVVDSFANMSLLTPPVTLK